MIGGWQRRPKSLTKNASPYLRRTARPLEKQLHNSRINVIVENGIAILLGAHLVRPRHRAKGNALDKISCQ